MKARRRLKTKTNKTSQESRLLDFHNFPRPFVFFSQYEFTVCFKLPFHSNNIAFLDRLRVTGSLGRVDVQQPKPDARQ
jgi:hypothetical protein